MESTTLPAAIDTAIPDSTNSANLSTKPKLKSKSKKRARRPSQSHEIRCLTLPPPPYSYLHLTLLTSFQPVTSQSQPQATNQSNQVAPDILTLRTYLTRALTQYLGLHGSSIPIDILKTGKYGTKQGGDVWIRVPRQDCNAVVAAVGGWTMTVSGTGEEVGWRVKGKGEWLGGLVGREMEVVEGVWGD